MYFGYYITIKLVFFRYHFRKNDIFLSHARLEVIGCVAALFR